MYYAQIVGILGGSKKTTTISREEGTEGGRGRAKRRKKHVRKERCKM